MEYQDPEDEAPKKDYPEMGKRYKFAGIALEPFSVAREDLYTRLTFDALSEREAAGLMVFICTQPAERCVMVRGQKQEAEFRLECAEWLEKSGWRKEKVRSEAIRIHREILRDIEHASNVEPDFQTEGGKTPSGKQ